MCKAATTNHTKYYEAALLVSNLYLLERNTTIDKKPGLAHLFFTSWIPLLTRGYGCIFTTAKKPRGKAKQKKVA